MVKRIILLVYTLFVVPACMPTYAQTIDRFRAKIVERSDKVMVELQEGEQKGKEYSVQLFDKNQLVNQNFQTGDSVLVSFVPGGDQVVIVDHYRSKRLLILFIFFVVAVVSIARWKGALALVGMLFSFLIIARMIVPQIVVGNNPFLISLLGALLIVPASFYLSHGLSRKSTLAVLSTFISLFITAALAFFAIPFAKLTGFAAEEAVFVQTIAPGINIQGLLLAGIVISSMGILDDVTISQVGIVQKLKKANPKYSQWELFRESMDLGRDHIASLVNTLVVVYAGAALPLFVLLQSGQFSSYSEVVNMEIVAAEVVQTLVASIGIIAAVPIASLLGSKYIK